MNAFNPMREHRTGEAYRGKHGARLRRLHRQGTCQFVACSPARNPWSVMVQAFGGAPDCDHEQRARLTMRRLSESATFATFASIGTSCRPGMQSA